MSLQREIKVLEEKLQEVEAWEKRVQELEVLLGIQEGIGEDGAQVEVERDREEPEEVLLREMERREEEESTAVVGPEGDDTESSSFVSASLGSLESEAVDMVASRVDLGIGLDVESQDGVVGVTEDGIVVDVGFEEAVDEEEMEMEAGADIE